MSTQYDLFDAPAAVTSVIAPKQKGIVRRKDLNHSIIDCHRIEDALWRELHDLGCDEQSKAHQVGHALDQIACPTWCEQAAWDRIAESYRTWSTIFGNLELFRQLRHKRDD